jgi:hypothetical protein
VWHETRDASHKTAVNWVTKTKWPIGKHLNVGKTKLVIARSHLGHYGLLRTPLWEGTDQRHQLLFMVLQASNFPRQKNHCSCGLLGNVFTQYDLCDEHHE